MNVEFKDNNPFRQIPRVENSGLGGWLIKNGLAKDQKNANQLMIIISIVCMAIAVYFAMPTNTTTGPTSTLPLQTNTPFK